MSLVINQSMCSCCHRCRTECPVQAITFRNSKYWIDPDKCISCGSCMALCHNGAISDPDNPVVVQPHEKLFKSCDVCVVGGGGAGMVAAVKAADAGLKVIVLEKAHEVGGCAWYAGGFRTHFSKWHEAIGEKDLREEKFAEFMEKTENKVDPKLLRRLFKANEDFFNWLVDEHDLGSYYELGNSGAQGGMPGPMGPRLLPKFTWEHSYKRIDEAIGPGEIGWFLMQHLEKELLAKGGEILCKTAGKSLLTDDSGAVVGVLAEDAGGELEISSKAVILAAGAFTHNREIMAKMQPLFYDDEGKEPVHIFTVPTCTGDAITMGEAIGAEVDYENRRVNLFGPMRHPYPGPSLHVTRCGCGMSFGSQGNVMHREGMHEVSPLVFDPKRISWTVVDTAMVEAAMEKESKKPPQSPGMNMAACFSQWKEYFAEEEVAGSIVSAATLEELADKLGFDRAGFLGDVAAYNDEMRLPPPPIPAGTDDFAAMMRANMIRMPLEQGPFYAIRMKLFHEDAVGGLVTNENTSVMRDGQPIPGLYAAGDTTRGIMVPGDVGVNYVEGVFTCLTQAFNEGYIAGEEAAKFACL